MMLLLLLSFWSSVSSAGNRVGNGGDVLLCTPAAKDGERIQLLDFEEAESSKLIDPGSTKANDILRGRLERLKKLAPELSAQYFRRIESIHRELEFKTGVALVNVNDSLHSDLPDDQACSLRQIVIRKNFSTENEKRFVIDAKLWEKLSELNRAGLIMHEVIYEHFWKLGQTDSRRARKLNHLIFSKQFETMTEGKFWLFIKDLNVPIYP